MSLSAQYGPDDPMHPIGIALCVMGGLVVATFLFLIIREFLFHRNPNLSDPKKALAHHILLLAHHDTGDPNYSASSKQFAESWVELVPASAQSDTVQGEIIRAVDRLASEDRRNGSLNWDSGYIQFIEFLRDRLLDREVFSEHSREQLSRDIDLVELNGTEAQDSEKVRIAFGRLIMASVEYRQQRPDLIEKPTDPKMRM
jgi:hypothetical protein